MKNLITRLAFALIIAFSVAPLMTGCSSSNVVAVNRAVQPSNPVYTGPVKVNGADVMADYEDRKQQLPGLYAAGPDKISQTFIVFDKGLKFHILDDYSLLSDINSVNATSLGPEEIKAAEKGKKVIIPYELYYSDGTKKLEPKQIKVSF